MQLLTKLHCRFSSHDWQPVPHTPEYDPEKICGRCGRCGAEATMSDAFRLRVGGGGPPASLLDQSPGDEIAALYREGQIDDHELEVLSELQARDDAPEFEDAGDVAEYIEQRRETGNSETGG